MFILYDLIFIIFALSYAPIFIFRRKFHSGFLMRLGIFPEKLKQEFYGKRPIWLHVVSVGEALASRSLLECLHREYPGKQILISTVTPTGNRIARSLAGEKDAVIYLPLDISFIVNRVLNLIKPSLFIIAETEIWPNLIRSLRKRNVPIIVVNARISDGSYKGYRLIKFSLAHILHKINLFCVQTETDYLRLLSLGVEKEKIRLTGNMKFDTSTPFSVNGKRSRSIDNTDYTKYRLTLELKQNDRLLVAGSTHLGEEEIILAVYQDLLTEFPELRLLIAPRHPERAAQIEGLIQRAGFDAVRLSRLEALRLTKSSEGNKQQGNKQAPLETAGQLAKRERSQAGQAVFLLDTIGQLIFFYAIADIVFVGGSLIKKGGHNILEPAIFGKPILFGPWTFNFRDITNLFLKHKASLLVRNEGELKECMKNLLLNPATAEELSQGAQELILENQGATKRNLEYIRQYFSF